MAQTVNAAARLDAIPLRRTPTDLRMLLSTSLNLLKQQARAGDITLTEAVDPSVPEAISIDADKIAWVVTALVGNALRYVRRGSHAMPGGSITVRATPGDAGRDVVIEVQDDGPGIPRDRLPVLSPLGSNQPRVALGLMMVRDVVAAHGGAIDVQSDTGTRSHGTTIRIRLPVV